MNPKESFVIQGLAGKKSLQGSVKINGAKNAALKAIAAVVLFDGPTTLENIPDTNDVKKLFVILEKLGAKVGTLKNGKVVIDPSSITKTDIDYDLAQSMRSSIVLTGPLLARFNKVSFPSPGGCVIGTRPIDLFIDAYEKLGATADLKKDVYDIQLKKGVKDIEIFFNLQSVTATETVMMTAVLGSGTVTLKNCAMEPEIVNVAEWLNACGAHIQGVGTSTMIIKGTAGKLLSAKKSSYVAVPDRIEAESFLILGAACAKKLTITDCRPEHMDSVINLLKNSGVKIETSKDSVTVYGESVVPFKPFSFRTHEYPGVPTDVQAPLVVFLTQTVGEGTVFETIFEGRFKYVEDLIKMGANITVMNPREILAKGPVSFKALADGEELRAHDIRAGFAIVMAALIGTGSSTITNIHLIDRGYEKLEEKLRALGADIKRV